MLWAKDVRQEMLFSNPEMDFATISRRLGEMWANVPSTEKYNWRRRAKRLNTKGKDKNGDTKITIPKSTVSTSKFLNRNPPTPRTKKSTSVAQRASISPKDTGTVNTTTASVHPANSNHHKTSPSGIHKPSGTAPVDVAAHLKLLGDSLTIIGERLKEHEVNSDIF